MSLFNKIISAFVLFVLFSCQDEVKETQQKKVKFSQEDSAELNRQLIKELNYTIDDYVKRNGWNLVTSPTGLRYMIYEYGEGIKAEAGMIALIEFDITLLDGTVCYSSKKEGAKSFKIEQSDVESGLHEAVQYMRVGDKAKVIIPHYKAHGLIGDSEKIPPLSPIVYDIHLLALSDY